MTNLYTYIQSDNNIAESILRNLIRTSDELHIKYVNKKDWDDMYMSIYQNKNQYEIPDILHKVFGDMFYLQDDIKKCIHAYKWAKSNVYVYSKAFVLK